MRRYIIITKNTPDTINLMSGYQNAEHLYSDDFLRIHLWTNSTIDDANALADMQERRMVLGLLLLPEAV